MKFTETPISGLVAVSLEPNTDERGSFARFFCRDQFHAASIATEYVQGSISRNISRGTLRGMHMQLGPQPEAKLVRCTRGRAYDVVLDLRKNSDTYLRWLAFELDAESGLSVFIPGGCAHGFLTLESDTELTYLMTAPYEASHQCGFRWNDPAFGIEWPFAPAVISSRDCAWPDYSN